MLSNIFTDAYDSPSHLYMRKKEDNFDPDDMDEHDSFYFTTRSLLVMFQIMGIMPIQRSPKGLLQPCVMRHQSINLHNLFKGDMPRTTFSWTSRAFAWAYFIYAIETIVVCLVLRERLQKFSSNSDKKFDEVIYNVIFMSMFSPHFLL